MESASRLLRRLSLSDSLICASICQRHRPRSTPLELLFGLISPGEQESICLSWEKIPYVNWRSGFKSTRRMLNSRRNQSYRLRNPRRVSDLEASQKNPNAHSFTRIPRLPTTPHFYLRFQP